MITDLDKKIFARSIALMGEEKFLKLKKSNVLIVGLGGVGSAAAEAIARMGVSNILICDFDTVDISNINRQILAFCSTIDSKKVDIMSGRIKDINPDANVVPLDLKIGLKNLEVLNEYKIDCIVDAIDSFEDKVELIKYAKDKDINIISSMGTGGKIDPTGFKVADYLDTKYCKLAKKLRKTLRDIGIESLKVVYSEEKSKNDFSKYDFVSSISFVPPVVGYILASEVFKDLTDYEEIGVEF